MELKELAEMAIGQSKSKETAPYIELRSHSKAVEFSAKLPIIKENMQSKFGGELSLLNSDLKNAILTYGDRQQRKTNVKAYMTDWFMHKEFKTFEIIGKLAWKMAVDNSPHKIQFELFDIWGAVYKKDDWTITHDHWPHPWSFVYYVQSSGETPLVFPDASQDARYIFPKTGDMVLFPGLIRHGVPQHHSDEDRIVIAGNFNPIVHIY